MKKISMMQAAGEAGQCIVGFVVAAMLFYILAGAMVFLFVALAVVAPVLILLNAYADGMIFQERGGGGDEDDLENDSKTVLADSNADSDSGDSKNDDSDSATMSADSERPSSEEKP